MLFLYYKNEILYRGGWFRILEAHYSEKQDTTGGLN